MKSQRQRREPPAPARMAAIAGAAAPGGLTRFGRVRHGAGRLLEDWYALRTLGFSQVRHAHQP